MPQVMRADDAGSGDGRCQGGRAVGLAQSPEPPMSVQLMGVDSCGGQHAVMLVAGEEAGSMTTSPVDSGNSQGTVADPRATRPPDRSCYPSSTCPRDSDRPTWPPPACR